MKTIVAGGRDFDDWQMLVAKLPAAFTLISGCARGADTLAIKFAESRGLKCIKMPADWARYGNAAGVKRNEEMARIADTLIAFWNGESRGTRDMITRALRHGLELHVYRY